MLRQNLEALAAREPELGERIGWPVESDHVVHDDSGEVHYRLGDGRYRLSLPPEAVDRALAAAAAVPAGAAVFVYGIGLGELPDALLAARPDVTVVAWERDPWLVRLALGAHDWSRELASGRLRLLMGSDLVSFARASAAVAWRPAAIVFHPFLGAVYRTERLFVETFAETFDAAAPARPLALVCAGGLFVDDLSAALRAEGFALFTADIHRLAQDELARTVRQLQPTFIAAINYTEGLAEFAAALGCPLLCWEIDPATSAVRPVADSDGAHVFTYRRANVAEFRAAGFQHVEYLPLAADPARRAPLALDDAERARYGAAVSFVGSSLVPQADDFRRAFVAGLAALAPAAPQARDAAALLEELLAEQRRDFSRYDLPDALLRRVPALARLAPARVAELARLAGEVAAAEKRLAYVGRLGRFGVRVWGDDGWQAAGGATGAVYCGRAGHAIELSKIYCGSLINVDVGRLYQDDIVTMRVFDVLACGGFVLAERSTALGELFELGVEIDDYRTGDELEAKVELYLREPERARAIARRGQEAVRRRHTIAGRVAHMLEASGLKRGEVRG